MGALAMQDVILKLFWHADRREWDELIKCFGHRLLADYSSITGKPAKEIDPADQIAMWKPLLGGFDATQHLLSGIRVESTEESATAYAQFQAQHVLGDEFWMLGGSYEFGLERVNHGWCVTRMVVTKLWESGNTELPRKVLDKA